MAPPEALPAFAVRLRLGGKAGAMAQVVTLRALALAVNVGTSLLTAALLGPGGRGEQAALVIAPTFLGGLASLGLHGALIYNMNADPAHERELVGNGMLLALCTGSVAMAIGWVAEPYWLRQYSADTVLVGRILLLVTPLTVIGWTMSGAAETRGWFGLVNRLLYVQSLATLALLGGLVLMHALTPRTSACAYILPTIATFSLVFARIARQVRPVFRWRWALVRQLARYAVRLSGVDILATLSNSIDQMIVVALLPSGMVGIYAVALSSARLLAVVQAGITSVLFPSVAAREVAAIVRTVATAFRIGTLLIAGLAAILAVAGPPLLLLAYGAKFASVVAPFRVLLLAAVMENGARILYQIYSASGRPELVTAFECAAIAVLVFAMFALMPGLGTLGAAIAVLVAATFRVAIAVAGLKLASKVDRPRLVFGRMDLRMIRAVLWRAPAAQATPP